MKQSQIDLISFIVFPFLVGLNFNVLPEEITGGRYAGLLMIVLLVVYLPAMLLLAFYNWLERKNKGLLPLPFLTRPILMIVMLVLIFYLFFVTNKTLDQFYVGLQYVFTFLFFPSFIAFGTSGFFFWKSLKATSS